MRFDVAIIGGGPSATYALDRLAAALAGHPPERPLEIGVFERTGKFGCGSVHADDQPITSYLNRAAADIALGAGLPPFLDWARRLGFDARGAPSRTELSGDATPARALHGNALVSAFASYRTRIEGGGIGRCHLIDREVQAIRREPRTGAFGLWLPGDEAAPSMRAGRLLLVTGHISRRPEASNAVLRAAAERRPDLSYLSDPYPLTQIEARIDVSAARICIEGMGLSAIDLMLHLTEGQGGRFERDRSGRIHYFPSGGEPRYLGAISPSGVLITARPRNEKAATGAPPHLGVFYTEAAIDQLRATRGQPPVLPNGEIRRQLDFERDALPLIVMEMALAFRTHAADAEARARLARAVQPLYHRFLMGGAEGGVGIDDLIAPILTEGGSATRIEGFNWRAQFQPVLIEPDCHNEVLALAERDLARAEVGNLVDPEKRMADLVWRDLRPVHNYLLDFGGLTARSEAAFQFHYLRAYHRSSNGSCREAMEKVICLGRSGFVDFSAGPRASVAVDAGSGGYAVISARRSPVTVDCVICGHLPRFHPETDAAPLYRNALADGLLTLWVNPDDDGGFTCGAIAADRNHHPLDAEGQIDRRITLIGTPVEGLRYFQQSLARPRASGGVIAQLAAWAEEVSRDLG